MENLQKVKAVIFDMDGVLLDSESVCDRTWEIVFKEMGLPSDNEILQECRGCNKTDSVQILKRHLGQDFDAVAFLQRTSFYFHQIEEKEGVPLMPFVCEALEALSRKYILCLASSTRKETVVRMLANAGILKYFKTLTTGDMVTHSKPDPQIYLMACQSIGIPPEECIAIEDSYNGVRSGVAAHIRTIMVPDKLPPTKEIETVTTAICASLKEVVELLGC